MGGTGQGPTRLNAGATSFLPLPLVLAPPPTAAALGLPVGIQKASARRPLAQTTVGSPC